MPEIELAKMSEDWDRFLGDLRARTIEIVEYKGKMYLIGHETTFSSVSKCQEKDITLKGTTVNLIRGFRYFEVKHGHFVCESTEEITDKAFIDKLLREIVRIRKLAKTTD